MSLRCSGRWWSVKSPSQLSHGGGSHRGLLHGKWMKPQPAPDGLDAPLPPVLPLPPEGGVVTELALGRGLEVPDPAIRVEDSNPVHPPQFKEKEEGERSSVREA